MRYVKHLTKAVLLSLGLILFGCATSGDKLKLVTDPNIRPDLLSTQEYIPVQKADPEGGFLVYEPSDNPYLSQRGRVKRDSVQKFMEARRAYRAGHYDQAEALLLALSDEDPGLSGPWVMLGDIATAREDYGQAISYHLRAIETNRLNVNAYLRLAKNQRLRGDFLHAQNTYAKVLSIWPDFPEAHLNLAVLYDVYLNHPLRAQRHMESYQFLTGGENEKVSVWLSEIQRRTGIAPLFEHQDKLETDSLSYNE